MVWIKEIGVATAPCGVASMPNLALPSVWVTLNGACMPTEILGEVPESVDFSQSAYQTAGMDVIALAREFWVIFGPGGKLHPGYFLEHKGHLLVEGLLVVVIAFLFLQSAFKPSPNAEEPLTDKAWTRMGMQAEAMP